ncbi:MAG: alkaline phosphatase family protein [Phycisphaerae bacterium]
MLLNGRRVWVFLLLPGAALCQGQDVPPVGPTADGAHVVPTAQLIRPAGETLELAGRPVDMVLAPNGQTLYVKDNRGVIAVDAERWKIRQELRFEREGGSMLGIAVTSDGARVFATTAKNTLAEATVGADGKLAWTRKIELPGPNGKGASFPCGVALSPDQKLAYVCLSRNNSLGVVELESGRLLAEVAVGVAPYAVRLSPDGRTAYVSNWGGRRAAENDRTAKSSGTDAVVDERGIAASGTISLVNLDERRQVGQVSVGLSPAGLALSADGRVLYVANANSDTVSFVDTSSQAVVETLTVRPDASLPFGSMPNGLALSHDGRFLYVANAGNNAVGVVRLAKGGARSAGIAGFIPAGWYPGALVATEKRLYVANIKGVGSRSKRPGKQGWNSHWHRGTVSRLDLPSKDSLARYTARVRRDARVPQILRSLERADKTADAVPVPEHPGQPSVFEHVVYIIKENRTYDQVFGDMPVGNNDPTLCIYGREVTPNHHAIAEQFVLLDNYYCSGVLSADGHSWATEGNVTPYLERSFGGFSRSYTFGDDPLTYSSSGFVWDHVLAHGLSFRNYGEFDYAEEVPDSDYATIYEDFIEKTGKFKWKQNIGVENLRRYSCPEYPGWNMDIPDVLRAEVFLKEFAQFEQNGEFPNFVIIYLPNDHTSGTAAGHPTPRSLVADNDLALGRIVEAISKSRYWPKTCIFVIEDDPQDGFDHVDGHRSLCLVVSPYARRGEVVSAFYNQGSVLHTIERMLGIPAYNQLYAMAPVMSACFTSKPDLAPYLCQPNQVPLAEMNPRAELLPEKEHYWAARSAELPLKHPDAADEDLLNRILWHAARGVETPYPAPLAGAHGRGLAALNLRLASTTGSPEPDDDD